jgi:hypothetical protein
MRSRWKIPLMASLPAAGWRDARQTPDRDDSKAGLIITQMSGRKQEDLRSKLHPQNA